MFDKYHAIDNISTEYSLEKVELEDARKALDDIESEKEFIIEKQRKLEEEERAAQLLIIRSSISIRTVNCKLPYTRHHNPLLIKNHS